MGGTAGKQIFGTEQTKKHEKQGNLSLDLSQGQKMQDLGDLGKGGTLGDLAEDYQGSDIDNLLTDTSKLNFDYQGSALDKQLEHSFSGVEKFAGELDDFYKGSDLHTGLTKAQENFDPQNMMNMDVVKNIENLYEGSAIDRSLRSINARKGKNTGGSGSGGSGGGGSGGKGSGLSGLSKSKLQLAKAGFGRRQTYLTG